MYKFLMPSHDVGDGSVGLSLRSLLTMLTVMQWIDCVVALLSLLID